MASSLSLHLSFSHIPFNKYFFSFNGKYWWDHSDPKRLFQPSVVLNQWFFFFNFPLKESSSIFPDSKKNSLTYPWTWRICFIPLITSISNLWQSRTISLIPYQSLANINAVHLSGNVKRRVFTESFGINLALTVIQQQLKILYQK